MKNNEAASRLLETIRTFVRKETFTEGKVLETILEHVLLIKDLYNGNFCSINQKDFEQCQLYRKSPTIENTDLVTKIQKGSKSDIDKQIFMAIYTFNRHVLKTNFYKNDKIALSFKLNPKFLSTEEYPVTPFGLFFVVGTLYFI